MCVCVSIFGCPAQCEWKNKWCFGKPLNACMKCKFPNRKKNKKTPIVEPLGSQLPTYLW